MCATRNLLVDFNTPTRGLKFKKLRMSSFSLTRRSSHPSVTSSLRRVDVTTNLTPHVQLGISSTVHTVPKEETSMTNQTAVDPVCGMTVTPDSAAASREHDGTTYYFCSTHCAAAFDADPQRYTAAPAEQ